jgi:predicted permease
MILVIAAFAIIFFVPSVIFSLSFHSNFKKIHNQQDLKRRFSLSAIISLFSIVVTFFLWAFLSDRFHTYEKSIGWSFFLISLFMIFLMNYFSVRRTVSIAQEYQDIKQKRETALFSYVGAPFLIILIISLFFAFSFVMVFRWVNTKMAGDNIEMLLKVALLVSFIGVVSLLPGMVYVCTDTDSKNSSLHFKFGILVALLWPLFTGM